MPKSFDSGEAEIYFKPFLHASCGRSAVDALDEFIGSMTDAEARFLTTAQMYWVYDTNLM